MITPTQYLPWILEALNLCGERLAIPVLYNTGGYERVETLRALEGRVDIYLPDFKYADPALGARLSSAGDYPAAARAAIRPTAIPPAPGPLSGPTAPPPARRTQNHAGLRGQAGNPRACRNRLNQNRR